MVASTRMTDIPPRASVNDYEPTKPLHTGGLAELSNL